MGYLSRTEKGSALNISEHDTNLELLAKGRALDPVIITASTTLTAALHEGREIFCNTATAMVLTIALEADGGPTALGARFFGTNIGVGEVTLTTSTTGILYGDALLPATVSQWSPFEAIRIDTDTYVRRA
jgi:hypothetical protein